MIGRRRRRIFNIDKIGLKLKSPRLGRFSVTQSPVKEQSNANVKNSKGIIIIIIIMSCRQHGYPWPSLATSPYHSSPQAGLQGYILCPHIVAVCKFALVILLFYVGVHRSTSLMSSSLLLQYCPACLVRLTCIVFVMGGKCPYSWCLVGCCRQDLFNTALNILV